MNAILISVDKASDLCVQYRVRFAGHETVEFDGPGIAEFKKWVGRFSGHRQFSLRDLSNATSHVMPNELREKCRQWLSNTDGPHFIAIQSGDSEIHRIPWELLMYSGGAEEVFVVRVVDGDETRDLTPAEGRVFVAGWAEFEGGYLPGIEREANELPQVMARHDIDSRCLLNGAKTEFYTQISSYKPTILHMAFPAISKRTEEETKKEEHLLHVGMTQRITDDELVSKLGGDAKSVRAVFLNVCHGANLAARLCSKSKRVSIDVDRGGCR